MSYFLYRVWTIQEFSRFPTRLSLTVDHLSVVTRAGIDRASFFPLALKILSF